MTTKGGPAIAKIEKTLHQVFKSIGLKITTTVNVKRVEFLDAILDLETGKTEPYRKPLDTPKYVNANSSHPPSVIKHIPKSVEARLSVLSSSETEFNRASPPYKEALKKVGYSYEIKYSKPVAKDKRKNRPRNQIWVNPPYSKAVDSNLTKIYAEIIDKAFPKNHPYLRKLFNKNNMRLSYSCTPNMSSIISSHNKKLLKPTVEPLQKLCNCGPNKECPMEGKCLASELVYQADVKASDNSIKKYIGLTEPTFKIRYGNHLKSFKNRAYATETMLSKRIWYLKDQGLTYNVKWKILKMSRGYSPITQTCRLCFDEKLSILKNSWNPV